MLLHEHADFINFVRIVATDRGIRDAIVEKDYWVTHVLHEMRKSEFKDAFIFKGGTSLSKGWNLIDRFSEDIDLLIVPGELGTKAKKARMRKIQDIVSTLPGLVFDEKNPDNRAGNESRTSCFRYECRSESELGSLLPYIKVEMGFRGGTEPRELRRIQSVIGEALEKKGRQNIAENVLGVEMNLLHPKRTFVEKLYAIYSAYESGKISGKTRHYYDVFKLLGMAEVADFLGTEEYTTLKKSVAEFSRENWPASPLPPKNRLAGAAAFNPVGDQRVRIEREFAQSDIYYGRKPEFAEVIVRIQGFQERL